MTILSKGAMSVRAFRLTKNPGQDFALAQLEAGAFAAPESCEEGTVAGWVGPDHLFDGDFNAARVRRGPYLVFGLRVDTRRVPAPVLQAHTQIAIEEVLESEGLQRLPARRRREIKLQTKRELLAEVTPAQKAYGVFWNLESRRVFLASTSRTVVEIFRARFRQSFDTGLEELSAHHLTSKLAEQLGARAELLDARALNLKQELAS